MVLFRFTSLSGKNILSAAIYQSGRGRRLYLWIGNDDIELGSPRPLLQPSPTWYW